MYGLASGLALCIDLPPDRLLYRDRAKTARKKMSVLTFRKSTGRGTYEITIERNTRWNLCVSIYDLRSTPRIFCKLAFRQSDAEKLECAASVSSSVKIKHRRLVRWLTWKNWTRSISWFLWSGNFLCAETFLWNCIWKPQWENLRNEYVLIMSL